MNNWMKLALPLGLGLLAGVMHYQLLVTRLTPVAYTQANRDLNPGDRFDDDNLVPVNLTGDHERLAKILVPWKSRSVLYGWRSARELKKGDVVFFRDSVEKSQLTENGSTEIAISVKLDRRIIVRPESLRVGAALNFVLNEEEESNSDPRMVRDLKTGEWKLVPQEGATVTLGPVRILSIGADTIYDGRPSANSAYDPRNITLAFPRDAQSGDLVPWATRLLRALTGESDDRIMGVEVCRPEDRPRGSTSDLAMGR